MNLSINFAVASSILKIGWYNAFGDNLDCRAILHVECPIVISVIPLVSECTSLDY